MSDLRRRVRIGLSKSAMAKSEFKVLEGKLEDISANGASMSFSVPVDGDQGLFKRGDSVEIIIDDLSSLAGWVVRCDNKTVAIEFTHDSDSEKQLIAEIMETM